MRYFVFLEFADQKVRNFLNSLRDSLTGGVNTKPIHVTVRGPYVDPPERGVLEQLSENLQGYGVVIGGAGTFKTKTGFAVYLRVQSPVFAEIWWKPDFNEFEIRPHVTIFETTSARAAKIVERFLRTERIEIFTISLSLAVYTSKQLELFETSIDPEVQKKRAHVERWSVKPGILQRAASLRDLLAHNSDDT